MGANSSTQNGGAPQAPQGAPIAAAPNPPVAPPSSNELQNMLQGVDAIRNLEEVHRAKLDEITSKRRILNDFKKNSATVVEDQLKELEHEKEEVKKVNKELYMEEMDVINKKKDAELDEMIAHVNTVVYEERKQMSREDVFSLVKRELDSAWSEGVELMKREQKNALAKQTAITTETYRKQFMEFKANLDAEYAEAVNKHKEEQSSSKKRSSSIFGWLSPSKRRREDHHDDDSD